MGGDWLEVYSAALRARDEREKVSMEVVDACEFGCWMDGWMR